MKKLVSKSNRLILLLILLAAGWLLYKPGPKHRKLLDERPAGPLRMDGQKHSIDGSVIRFGSNHDGDIDKLLLFADNKKIWLHFPPHAAREVSAVARINHRIEAEVFQESFKGSDGTFELSNLRSEFQQTTLDLAQIPAPSPRKGIEVEITGLISKDLKYKNEIKNSFILAGKQILLPPHMAQELFPLLRQAKTIFVKGQMRDPTEGFISASGLNVVRPNSIQIDSIIYKVR